MCKGVEQRLSLYADYLLLYVNNPVTCLPSILSILENFGSFSWLQAETPEKRVLPTQSSSATVPADRRAFLALVSNTLELNVTCSLHALFFCKLCSLRYANEI